MSAEKHDEAQPAEEGAPKKSRKKLIIAVLSVVGLVVGGGVPMLLMGGSEPAPEEAAEELVEEEHHEEKRVEAADLGTFIVNLSENNSFLKVHLLMEYDAASLDKQTAAHEGGAGGGEAGGGGASGGAKEAEGSGTHPHLAKRENQLRDVIIRILSSKKAHEVLSSDGKARLKEELIDGLNEAIGLEEPVVVGILFTDFIIQ